MTVMPGLTVMQNQGPGIVAAARSNAVGAVEECRLSTTIFHFTPHFHMKIGVELLRLMDLSVSGP
eukprot:767838-Amphidinium_carterae.1